MGTITLGRGSELVGQLLSPYAASISMAGNNGAKRRRIGTTTPYTTASIAERPNSYPAVDEIRKGYRRSVCGVDGIYYRVDNDGTVEIMAILGHQDAAELL